MTYTPLTRHQMAWRAAQDLPEGAYVNLGIGIPTLTSGFVPKTREVIFHSENGVLGMGGPPKPGEEDEELTDAGKNLTTLVTGGCYVHHADAFLMIPRRSSRCQSARRVRSVGKGRSRQLDHGR